MLDISQCETHMAKVTALAAHLGLTAQLQSRFDYLASYANGPGCLHPSPDGTGTRCRLFSDAVDPYSFEFLMETKQPNGTHDCWFRGGLIFHSAGDTGAGAPTYSVRVTDDLRAGWSVHT